MGGDVEGEEVKRRRERYLYNACMCVCVGVWGGRRCGNWLIV